MLQLQAARAAFRFPPPPGHDSAPIPPNGRSGRVRSIATREGLVYGLAVKRPTPPAVEHVVGYVRVSTEEQGDSGAGLESQRRQIRSEAERRGWKLVHTYEDVFSGRSVNGRHGLKDAIQAIERGEADGLVVAKLDRLSRSLKDFVELLERAREQSWALVALDQPVDTSTPQGEAMANMSAVFAQLERRLIGQRTREAMQVKKAQGVHLGRRSTLNSGTVRRIVGLRAKGESLSAIASTLNQDKVPTGQGGAQWWPGTVRSVLLRTGANRGKAKGGARRKANK
jgi:DNA invertase Pin-like site-specific DNA recombinase